MKCVCIKSKVKRDLQIKHCIQSTFLACLMVFKCGYAAENSPDVISTQLSKITYKFTTTYLGSSDDNNAIDVNLRAVDDMHTAWVGEYGDRNGFRKHGERSKIVKNSDGQTVSVVKRIAVTVGTQQHTGTRRKPVPP